MYHYWLYGMHVESFLELEECFPYTGEKPVDFSVVERAFPEEVQKMFADKSDSDPVAATSSRALAFRIPNVADYHSTEAEITVRPMEGAEPAQIKCYLLGSAFGYAMILRKRVVLHGGAVSRFGKGIIVTGESGAGKSTVTNSLREQGYSFISDDVCALTQNDKKMHINMAYPQQKLCRDAALKMGYALEDLIYINEERDKFAVRLKDGFLPEGQDFDYLFELVLSEDEKLCIRKVEGHEKLMLLLRNIYRGEGSFERWGMPPEYMKQCLTIASTIEIYQIARPANLNSLPEILEFINGCVERGM